MISSEKRVPFYSTGKDHFSHFLRTNQITGISNQSRFSQLTANQIVLQHFHTLLIGGGTLLPIHTSLVHTSFTVKLKERETVMPKKRRHLCGKSFRVRASTQNKSTLPKKQATASVSSIIRVEKVGW